MTGNASNSAHRPRTTLYRTTYGIYAVLAVLGLAALIGTLPIYDVVTLAAAIGAPAFVLSQAYGTSKMPAGYVFVWVTGILFGGSGIAAFALLS